MSHTTEDLVFEWLPEIDTPLVVDEGIELPQLELIQNFTADCTTNYSTGSFTCLEVVFRFKRRLGSVDIGAIKKKLSCQYKIHFIQSLPSLFYASL